MIGVAWLENKIYVVSQASNVLHVLQDRETGEESEEETMEVVGMKDPRDMTASKVSRSIFISDYANRCLWKMQLPNKEQRRVNVDGIPHRMSITPLDVLVLVVVNGDQKYLKLYIPSDVCVVKSILLSSEFGWFNHAVQLANENFIIAYSMKADQDAFLISELSAGGETIIRTFDPRSIRIASFTPYHLSIDVDGNVFIADYANDRVVLLNSRLTDFQVLLNKDQHSLESPRRMFYVQDRQQLVVGQKVETRPTQFVRVFNLSEHASSRNFQTEKDLIKWGTAHMRDEGGDQFSLPGILLSNVWDLPGKIY